jgi:hypothetical protein
MNYLLPLTFVTCAIRPTNDEHAFAYQVTSVFSSRSGSS